LFSTPEEASQSQLSDVGEVQTGERPLRWPWEPNLPLCYRRLNECAELESCQEELRRTFCVRL
ncbi:hypothetical protein G0U57_001771, partial [Chelydra serpentina]